MRLASDRLIQQTVTQGRKNDSEHFILYRAESLVPSTRFCLRVSKRIGSSPARNRIKRLMREFLRTNKDLWPAAANVVLIPKSGSVTLSFRQVATELQQILTNG